MPKSIYDRLLNDKQRAEMSELLDSEDRFDLSSEIAVGRRYLGRLLQIESKLDDPQLQLAMQAQQSVMAMQLTKMLKFARDVENAGLVFTPERVAQLVDKLAAIVTYRVTNESERAQILDDFYDLMGAFVRVSARGTMVTPDQDARLMDETIP